MTTQLFELKIQFQVEKTALHESRQKLQLILDQIPAMIGQWDRNLINVSANNVYTEYFSKTPKEIFGKHMRFLLGDTLFEKTNLTRWRLSKETNRPSNGS